MSCASYKNQSQGFAFRIGHEQSHCFCALCHLRPQIVCIFVNKSERAEIEEETKKPGNNTDYKDRKRFIVCVKYQPAGQCGSRNRAAVLDEVFHSLRRGADLGDSYIVNRCNDVGRRERHEDGSQTHKDKELVRLVNRCGHGKEDEDRAEQNTHTGDDDTSLFGAFEKHVTEKAAHEISRREDEDHGSHRGDNAIRIVSEEITVIWH